MSEQTFKYALPVGTMLRSNSHEYRIEKVLGVGGFGITYQVSTTLVFNGVPIFTTFALKEHFLSDACERSADSADVVVSRPQQKRVEESRQDFLAEARRLNALKGQCASIVSVSEVFEANNTVYYVMEFIDGGSLRDFVKAAGPMTEQQALPIVKAVAEAVAFLHKNRINHLDIKPDNIMLKQLHEGGTLPVIIDFGLSKHYDPSGRATSTVRIQGCSDGYSPVEQYVGINTFSPQADVYALGALYYYMLVGRDPIIATDITSASIVSALPPTVSQSARNAIVGAMQHNRRDRTASAEAFVDNVLGRETDDIPLVTPQTTTHVIDGTKPKRSLAWLWISIAAVVVLVAIGGGIYYDQCVLPNKDINLEDGEFAYYDDYGDSRNTAPADTVASAPVLAEPEYDSAILVDDGESDIYATADSAY